jgi:PAS domain S-box-containing protein
MTELPAGGRFVAEEDHRTVTVHTPKRKTMERASSQAAQTAHAATPTDIAALLAASDDHDGYNLADRAAAWLAAIPQPAAAWERYALAIALVALATGISRLIDDYLDSPTYVVMVLAVIFASWFGGFRGGLLATILAMLSVGFLIIEPRYTTVLDSSDVVNLIVFAIAGLIAGSMYHMMHLVSDRSLHLADDRERLLRAVVASEDRWHSLTESMPALVSSIASDGKVQYLNQTFIDYAGASRDAIAADPMAVVHPEDQPKLAAGWQHAVDTAAPYSMEWRIRRRDGAWRWHSGTTVPVRAADGSISGWVCSAVDIDDRRRMEDALAASRRELSRRLAEMEALFETAPVGIAIAEDPSCSEIRANGQFGRMLRAPEGQTNISLTPATGAPPMWYRVQRHGVDVPPGDLPIQRAGRTGEPVLGEHLDIVFDDGDVTTIFGGAMPLRDESGGVRGVISAWVDITERERYRGEQRILVDLGDALNGALEYEETLRAALASVVPAYADWCALYVQEDDGRIERRAAGNVYEGAVDRRSYTSVDAVPSWARRAFELGEQSLYGEIPSDVGRQITSDEEHLRMLRDAPNRSGIVAPLRAPGRVIGVMAFGMVGSGRRLHHRDEYLAGEVARRVGLAIENARLYRDAQKLLAQLQTANAAKDEFLGMVSHELKTPITTIMGNAEVLDKRASMIDDESRAAALADIRHDADRLNRIIGNLLTLARIDRGVPMDWEPVLLRRIVQKMTAEHQHQHPYRALHVHVAGPPGTVNGVVGYLEQITENLLSNAEKYSSPDQPIDVAVERNGDRVEVRVLDRGPGIPEDEAARLFTAFYRSPRTAQSAKGVGIGLAVCKRLIEAQRGAIWVRPREGGGSEFGFSLPVDDEA